MDFSDNTRKELLIYLNHRNIKNINCLSYSELVELANNAKELGISIDPEGIYENTSKIIIDKLTFDNKILTLPTLLDCDNCFSKLPLVHMYDITRYLKYKSSLADLREPKRLEGFQMQKDGHVLTMNCSKMDDNYSTVIGKIKPHTKTSDPMSGLPFYICWVILSQPDEDERIRSAFCCCRGG